MHNNDQLNGQQNATAVVNLKGVQIKDDYPTPEVHGCNGICQSGTSVKYRGLWVGVVFISALVALVSCYNITKEFSGRETATKIKLIQVPALLLPKITICSIAPVAMDTDKLDAYLEDNFPNASKELYRQFTAFMMAGSGFYRSRAIVTVLNSSQLHLLDRMYHTLRGAMTRRQYFHYFFREFGFTCTQLFHACSLGGRTVNCCEVFEPYYTVIHGYCLSSTKLYQNRVDMFGQLTLLMRQLPGYLGPPSLEVLLMYIHPHGIDIAPYPYYYVRPDYFNKVRLQASRVRLKDKCSDAVQFDKGTCYFEHSLGKRLRRLYNCSLPYWPVTNENRGLVACNPLTIAENYREPISIGNLDALDMEMCTVACDRWVYTATWEHLDMYKNFSRLGYQFRLLISYTDLQYEDVSQVVTLTPWGYVSQVGGQLGLFLGSSIVSLFQVIVYLGLFLKRQIKKHIYQPIRRIILAKTIVTVEEETQDGVIITRF